MSHLNVFPIFFDYIKDKVENDNAHIRQINVRGCSARILNSYLGRMLVKYFDNEGLGNIKFVNEELREDGSDLVLTSPIYNPKYEKLLQNNNYKKVKSLSISGGPYWKLYGVEVDDFISKSQPSLKVY